jgi:hypothetical protein
VLVVVSSAGTESGPNLGRIVTRQYRNAHLVVQLMGDGGPINQCGDLMHDWLIELDGEAVACPDAGARESMGVYPRVVAQQLPLAKPIVGAGDESTRWDRKLAAMSVAAARDWLIHSERPGTESGRGLRGGTWEITGGTENTADVAFDAIKWTRDVTMSGEFHLLPFDQIKLEWTADFEVDGPQGLAGTLHLAVSHRFEHDAKATITGEINGRAVAVVAPAL